MIRGVIMISDIVMIIIKASLNGLKTVIGLKSKRELSWLPRFAS